MATAIPATSVDPAAARAALAAVVPRLTALVRSVADPGAHAVGEWTAADVAVHLAHAWERLPALARGDESSPLRHPAELAGLTTALVRDDPDRDLEAAARRIEAAASAYLATPVSDVPRPWLVQGTSLPGSAFTCHLLNESLVHGYDIAQSQRRPWPIDPAYAGMALMGFLFRALLVVDPRFGVDQQKGAGVRACIDVRVRRTGRFFLVLDDGAATIEPPSARPVDCHLSAEPLTLFLLVWSRTGQWPGVLTGRLALWGRRPWVGARLPQILRNP
ncbi:MAG TPA: hypothetical protein VF112_01495 [Candidatus Dormibacteraeota bacterium]